jgi:cell division protease FtsH
MVLDSWLPVGFSTPDGEKVKIAIQEGVDWQIYESQAGNRILVAKDSLANRWFEIGLADSSQFKKFEFGGDSFFEYSSPKDYALSHLEDSESPQNKNEALSFASALKGTRELDKECSLHDAIYVERLSRLLPTFTLSPVVPDAVVFGTWITGGAPVSVESFRRLRTLAGWLGTSNLQDVVVSGGFKVSEKVIGTKAKPIATTKEEVTDKVEISEETEGPKQFKLAGRPELELFINEHVVDIVENEARYKALGIEFPSAIILHGPPGCGKTFAVDCLVDYLGWPSFKIEASSVASPYIHETSKKVAEVFETAMKNSPSVLVIDEMEAFLADRQSGAGSSSHKIEEVAEFLRRIPEAIKNHVLIIAMTNRIEMIDPAILRRGRFDHVVKVDMASEEEVCALLQKLISELPCEEDVKVGVLAGKLAGRPLSDVAFAVREGARLAARAGNSKIDQKSLMQALGMTPPREREEGSSRKIGFL